MPDIIAAIPSTERTLSITFDNGYTGELKLDSIITRYTGVFKPLLDPTYFNRVSISVDLGTVCWPNGADICPDSAYRMMQKTAINVLT